MRYDEHIFVLGEFTQGEYLFLVSILHDGKGPNTTQTRTSKLMKIQTIKNLIHKETNFQLPIRIQHCNDDIILIHFIHTYI